MQDDNGDGDKLSVIDVVDIIFGGWINDKNTSLPMSRVFNGKGDEYLPGTWNYIHLNKAFHSRARKTGSLYDLPIFFTFNQVQKLSPKKKYGGIIKGERSPCSIYVPMTFGDRTIKALQNEPNADPNDSYLNGFSSIPVFGIWQMNFESEIYENLKKGNTALAKYIKEMEERKAHGDPPFWYDDENNQSISNYIQIRFDNYFLPDSRSLGSPLYNEDGILMGKKESSASKEEYYGNLFKCIALYTWDHRKNKDDESEERKWISCATMHFCLCKNTGVSYTCIIPFAAKTPKGKILLKLLKNSQMYEYVKDYNDYLKKLGNVM
jgi:hypothetical protein